MHTKSHHGDIMSAMNMVGSYQNDDDDEDQDKDDTDDHGKEKK